MKKILIAATLIAAFATPALAMGPVLCLFRQSGKQVRDVSDGAERYG